MKIEIWILTRLGKEWWGREKVDEYIRRMGHWQVTIREFKKTPSPPREPFILLDERGTELTSTEFARKLQKWETENKKTILVIGGPFGVDEAWKRKAKETISLSKMTLPHQLALVLLVEQLYRGFTILSGHPYHH